MKHKRKTALVVCPGRGSYQKPELGYFDKYHTDKNDLLAMINEYRRATNQTEISELDRAQQFSSAVHTRSDNASSLIYACAYADFLSIDQSEYDIVGVTGNSMGWYIALACAQAISEENALHLIDTMGNIMQNQPGTQAIYPMLNENWEPVPGRREKVDTLFKKTALKNKNSLFDSIFLGGYRVFSGQEKAIREFISELDTEAGYPIRLNNHAAFHSPLMHNASDKAREILGPALFNRPSIPQIDGRGHAWSIYSSDINSLWDYTLGHQITEPYDFSRAIHSSMQSLAPDVLIMLGPGNTLGGATAQALLEIRWQGLKTKQDFISRQKSDPIILSFGLESQRAILSSS